MTTLPLVAAPLAATAEVEMQILEEATVIDEDGTKYEEEEAHQHEHIHNTSTQDEKDTTESFQSGDHVYVWCHAGVYQHHGILLQVNPDGKLIIADFTNLALGGEKDMPQKGSLFRSCESEAASPASRSFSGLPGGFRFLQEDPKTSKWRKVKYQAAPWELALWRSGTCSPKTPQPVDMILARVHFLMMHGVDLVPSYHVLLSNCETVAVWCMTGEWRTLQVSHLLNVSKTTSVLGTGGLYMSAAGTTTTIAATGFAGWAGATTEVSLLAANPLLLPVIAVTGIVVGGAALWNAIRTRQRWHHTSTTLNLEFQRYWTEPPSSGVQLIRQDDETEESME
jgi:hypothetical protein